MKEIENQYINVKIDNKNTSAEMIEELEQLAFEKYDCQGKHCFELSDSEIDHILKEDAFTSAQMTEDRIEKMEAAASDADWGYFFVKEDGLLFVQELDKKGVVYSVEEIAMDDWNSEWKKNYHKIHVSDELEVVPAWDKEGDSSEKVFIYPGMGFGTGTHETTFLCLKTFEDIKENFTEGDHCLDFGCGSGILGIAAIKRKKMIVDFCDVDSHALENCHQNILLNDYEKYCEGHEIVLRDRIDLKQYRLVFANILMDVLKEEAAPIGAAVEADGFLILSGLLVEQEDEVLRSYSQFKKIKTLEKNGWIAILLRKP